jgi:predicted DNA-binding WGR domain protein
MDLPLRFELRDAALNRARFYHIDCATTLFGELVIRRAWGRIGSRGQAMEMPCPDHAAAAEEIRRLTARRLRRGYRMLDRHPPRLCPPPPTRPPEDSRL